MRPDPAALARRDRRLLAAGLVALFAVTAVRDPAPLAALWAAALLLFHRGAAGALGRVARRVLPVAVGLSAASFGFLWWRAGAAPDPAPFAALALRTGLAAFVTFSVLDRVNLLRALAPWPSASRLAVVTLAQIHALRLLATESAQGLQSRLPRRPGPLDVLRNAGGVTAALLALAVRNAREVQDALRARGF